RAVVRGRRGFRAVGGFRARPEPRRGSSLIGLGVGPPVTAAGGRNFWRRGYSVLWDPAFWRQQLYVLVRVLVGWTLAIVEVSLLAAALGAIAMPIYYRWSHPELANGWPGDTLQRALLFVPAGLVLLLAGIGLLGPLRTLFRGLATRLLGEDRVAAMTPVQVRARRLHGLALHAGSYGVLNAVLIV